MDASEPAPLTSPDGVTIPSDFIKVVTRILPRLRLLWKPWTAKPGDPSGDTLWMPFCEPGIRAIDDNGKVGIRPQFGQGSRSFTEVAKHNLTKGRWTLWEEVEAGKSFKIFDLCNAWGGPIAFDNKLTRVIRMRLDAWDTVKAAFKADLVDAELAGGPHGGPTHIQRNPAMQQWRKDAEEKAGALAAYEFHRKHSKYQGVGNQPPEPKGERRQGFVVTDRRHKATADAA